MNNCARRVFMQSRLRFDLLSPVVLRLALFMLATLTAPLFVPSIASARLITRVVDGDTIVIQDIGPVRLIGVDTPETVDPRQPVQVFGKEASDFAKRLAVSHSGAAPLTQEALARYAASVVPKLDQTQTTPAPTKSWRQRHPIAAGALIGAAIGAGVGAISGALLQEHNMVTPEGLALVGGGLGAGTGAVVGLVVRKGR